MVQNNGQSVASYRKTFTSRKNLNLSHQVLENLVSPEHLARIEPFLEEFGDRYSQLPEWQKRHIMQECGGQKGSTVYAVLDELWRRSGGKGYAWPSVQYIANALCVHRSTVQRALNRLEELGLIVIDPNNLVYVLVVSKRAFLRNQPRKTESPVTPPQERLQNQPQERHQDRFYDPFQEANEQVNKQANEEACEAYPPPPDPVADPQPPVTQAPPESMPPEDLLSVADVIGNLKAKFFPKKKDWQEQKRHDRRTAAFKAQAQEEVDRQERLQRERDLINQGLLELAEQDDSSSTPQKSEDAHWCAPTCAPVRTEEIRVSNSENKHKSQPVTVSPNVSTSHANPSAKGPYQSKPKHSNPKDDSDYGRRDFSDVGFQNVTLTGFRHRRAEGMAGLIRSTGAGLDPYKDSHLVNCIAWIVACDVLTTQEVIDALRAAQRRRMGNDERPGIKNFGAYVYRMICRMVDRSHGYDGAGKSIINNPGGELPDISDLVFGPPKPKSKY